MDTLGYINQKHRYALLRLYDGVIFNKTCGLYSVVKTTMTFVFGVFFTGLTYWLSLFAVTRFSFEYLSYRINESKLDNKALIRFLVEQYAQYTQSKANPLYLYMPWETKSIDKGFQHFEELYGFKAYIRQLEGLRKKKDDNVKFSSVRQEQLPVMLACLKELQVIDESVTMEELSALFLRQELDKPIVIQHNGRLAYIFDRLVEKKLMPSSWGAIAERGNFFASKNGTSLKSSNFSASKSVVKMDAELERSLTKYIDRL